jgi:uncharacterized protein YeaO (DUF488 family)
MNIHIKRVYEEPAITDGRRILVDRLWPRGRSKEAAKIDVWLKEIAPSNELRRWYAHDPDKWEAFKSRYAQELDNKSSILEELLKEIRTGEVTFIYSSKERQLNNAVALKEYVETLPHVSRVKPG